MPKIVDHNEQRRKLYVTVMRLIATRGMDNTTLRNIAVEHNCTKGMVQHYCEGKQDLLMETWAFAEKARVNRIAAAGKALVGLELLQARLFAQLPSTLDIIYEWRTRLSFCTEHSMSDEMCTVQIDQRRARIRGGVACLRAANKLGILKSGLHFPNAYRSLESLVTGMAVSSVMEEGGLSLKAQRNILKSAIDDLRC